MFHSTYLSSSITLLRRTEYTSNNPYQVGVAFCLYDYYYYIVVVLVLARMISLDWEVEKEATQSIVNSYVIGMQKCRSAAAGPNTVMVLLQITL